MLLVNPNEPRWKSCHVHGKDIKNIVFFSDGEIIGSTNAGVFEGRSENNSLVHVTEIEEIDSIVKANKVNLCRKECFTTGNVLYIYGPLVNATGTKRKLSHVTDDGEKRYCDITTATFTINQKQQTVTFQERGSAVSEYTGKSAIVKELENTLRDNGFSDAVIFSAAKLVNDIDAIQPVLDKLKAL